MITRHLKRKSQYARANGVLDMKIRKFWKKKPKLEIPEIMVTPELEGRVRKAAKMIKEAKHLVFLTGAGMSTESGIPDFRSPGGLWEQYEPEIAANIEMFLKDPRLFWKMALRLVPALFKSGPNPGHEVLAKLEDDGYLKAILTQNIDGLHQKAGNIFVFELHGNINEMSCLGCGATYPQALVLRKVKQKQLPPLCDICAAPLKPNVVLFGEDLPRGAYYESISQSQKADVFVVCGSSLEVGPANHLPVYSINHGGKMIIINMQPTYMDDKAEIVFHEPLGGILPLIYNDIKRLEGEDKSENGTD